MKAKKTATAWKHSRRFLRHQQISELSLTYEGSNMTLRIHPPNISSKGMFINTSVPFPEGSILKLSFLMARTGVRIAVRCEVRYCLEGAGLGVEFIGLPPDCARAIETEMAVAGSTRRHSKPVKRPRRTRN
jgi:PilZ domain